MNTWDRILLPYFFTSRAIYRKYLVISLKRGRIVKYLCLSVKIAKSKNEKFSVVYAMQFGSESFNL